MIFTHKDYMTPEELVALYESVKARPLLMRTVWYEGQLAGPQTWLNWTKSMWLVRVDYDNGETGGFFWLDAFCGRTARIHFAIYDEYQQDAMTLGHAVMNWLQEYGWLYSVYGVTPVVYRHVIPFIEALGFQILGKVPGACFMERKNKHIDAVVSVYTFRR